MQTKPLIFALLACFAVTGTAQAALHDRGGGLIYDDVLNITWLQDANLAVTNTFGLAYNTDLGDHPNDSGATNYSEQINTDGTMSWGAALHWLDAMNAANYLGYDNWRLPSALDADGVGLCSGYNCTGSEMGHMFYEDMGATADNSILLGSNADNLALFKNLQSYVYWSGLAYAQFPHDAGLFDTSAGFQGASFKSHSIYAWAVRSGDVAAPVPEPEAYALMLAGLGLVGWAARRKQAA